MNHRRTVAPSHLRELIDRNGGFTLDLRTGRVPGQGISICTHPASSVVFPRTEWSDAAVSEWVQSCAERPLWRRSLIGGWHDAHSGHVWLDLVHVVSPHLRHGACLLGRALRQRSVFDIGRGELVQLDGAR